MQQGRKDVLSAILEYNAGRDPERLTLKFAALRRDAHSFLRGTCHRYMECLPDDPLLRGGPNETPLATCCGDMHLENFGSYVGDNGLAYFDINDFDEAALAPVVHDPLRLVTHLLVFGDSLSLSGSDTRDMAQIFIDCYADTLASGKARWVERDTAQGLVRDLLDDLRKRTLVKMLDSRTELKAGQRRIRLDGIKALPASKAQKAAVTALLADFAASQQNPAFYKPLDIARRISGNASLGLERYIILVQGAGSANSNALLDLKLATPSVLATAVTNPQPAWKSEAARMVALQAAMQAMPVAFLHALRGGNTRNDASFVLRLLQPGQDRVELEHCRNRPKRLARLLATMAQTLAWAQLRGCGRQGAATVDELITFAQQKPWRKQLLTLARQCARQVEADWRDYAKAYDESAKT
ncbi:MAG TPA: DUF2252 family protein [Rhodocyclaceae bacterium]|nr:DUF2252 family protein [Rhodocyclaceae bacterium]